MLHDNQLLRAVGAREPSSVNRCPAIDAEQGASGDRWCYKVDGEQRNHVRRETLMGKLEKTIIVQIAIVALAACATSYREAGFWGEGFKDTQLAPDVFRVSFTGSVNDSQDRVQDLALLRASELCLSNGFPYFVVVNTADQSTSTVVVIPGSSTTTGTVRSSGNTGTYTGQTTQTPSQVYNLDKPGVGLMVRGLKESRETFLRSMLPF